MQINLFVSTESVRSHTPVRSFVRSFCFGIFILFAALFVRFSSFACGLVLFYFGVVLIGDFVNIHTQPRIYTANNRIYSCSALLNIFYEWSRDACVHFVISLPFVYNRIANVLSLLIGLAMKYYRNERKSQRS